MAAVSTKEKMSQQGVKEARASQREGTFKSYCNRFKMWSPLNGQQRPLRVPETLLGNSLRLSRLLTSIFTKIRGWRVISRCRVRGSGWPTQSWLETKWTATWALSKIKSSISTTATISRPAPLKYSRNPSKGKSPYKKLKRKRSSPKRPGGPSPPPIFISELREW